MASPAQRRYGQADCISARKAPIPLSLFNRSKDKPEITPGGSIVHRHTAASWSPTQIGFSGKSSARFGETRDRVYLERFGEAKTVSHEVLPLIPHIDIMEYHRAGKNGPVCVLVTSGMSDLAMKVPAKTEAPRRIELIFYCTEPRQEYIDTLRWLAHFPHDQKTWIGALHTIPNGNPPAPMWGTVSLDTIFLLPPIVIKDQNLQNDLVLDGDGVEFVWIAPITTAECNLKLAQGSDVLLDLFQSNRHPHVFSGDRSSYV
jgi:hypothetical protein